MTVYLDEECLGEDRDTIAYPHLLLCMGVTVLMTNGRLVGVHVTNGNSEERLLAELKRRIDADPARPRILYVIGHLQKHVGQAGRLPHEKARLLGFTGLVYF